MKKLVFIQTVFFLSMLLISCSTEKDIKPFSITSEKNVIVKSMPLKYLLSDTLEEIYLTQVATNDIYDRKTYESIAKNFPKIKEHFDWMEETYLLFSEDMKQELELLYGKKRKVNPWYLVDFVTSLYDEASFDEIMAYYRSISFFGKYSFMQGQTKESILKLFPYFYNNFFREYIEKNQSYYIELAQDMNHRIEADPFDIITYMQKMSGINFSRKYKAVFYYGYRPIGAFGSVYEDFYISTIPPTVKEYSTLYSVPFHEFSHELFKTFTIATPFTDACKSKLEDKQFYDYWINKGLNNSYGTWSSWCEENLVEGFSKYLYFVRYGYMNQQPTYYYDMEFYEFLKNTDFHIRLSNKETTLERACIEFLTK